MLFVPTLLADNAMRVVQNAHVIKAARDAGVKHILYTGYAFAEHSSLPLTSVHLATEYGIQAAEIPYTFLRNSLYLHLFLDPGLLRRAIARAELVTNAGTGKVNAVTREDLAAAAALIGEGHENKAYNLVAPEPWTFDDLAAMLTEVFTEVSGKKVVHRQASFAEVKADLVDAGLPEQLAEQQAGFYAAIAAGETARSSEDLVQLIGTPTSLQETVSSGPCRANTDAETARRLRPSAGAGASSPSMEDHGPAVAGPFAVSSRNVRRKSSRAACMLIGGPHPPITAGVASRFRGRLRVRPLRLASALTET